MRALFFFFLPCVCALKFVRTRYSFFSSNLTPFFASPCVSPFLVQNSLVLHVQHCSVFDSRPRPASRPFYARIFCVITLFLAYFLEIRRDSLQLKSRLQYNIDRPPACNSVVILLYFIFFKYISRVMSHMYEVITGKHYV